MPPLPQGAGYLHSWIIQSVQKVAVAHPNANGALLFRRRAVDDGVTIENLDKSSFTENEKTQYGELDKDVNEQLSKLYLSVSKDQTTYGS